jgi:hypothetical protein
MLNWKGIVHKENSGTEGVGDVIVLVGDVVWFDEVVVSGIVNV